MIILDLETTGLDPSKHEIVEIGAVRAETGETFEVKVLPLHLSDADLKALSVNGYNGEEWEEAFLLPHALELLNQFIGDDTFLMTWNVSFDWSFLGVAYRATGIKDPFNYHHLDLCSIVWNEIEGKRDPYIISSLSKACFILSIDPEPQPHRALAGALTAYQVYKKLI